jgi:hypothetical protein
MHKSRPCGFDANVKIALRALFTRLQDYFHDDKIFRIGAPERHWTKQRRGEHERLTLAERQIKAIERTQATAMKAAETSDKSEACAAGLVKAGKTFPTRLIFSWLTGSTTSWKWPPAPLRTFSGVVGDDRPCAPPRC